MSKINAQLKPTNSIGSVCCDVWIYLLNVVFIDVNVSVFYLLFPQMNTFLKVQHKCVRICHKLTDGIQMDNHAFFFFYVVQIKLYKTHEVPNPKL